MEKKIKLYKGKDDWYRLKLEAGTDDEWLLMTLGMMSVFMKQDKKYRDVFLEFLSGTDKDREEEMKLLYLETLEA